MPRLRLRLSTLALFIVIIALATAQVIQWRREMALKARVQVLEAETARNLRLLDRYTVELARQRQDSEPRTQTDRSSAKAKLPVRTGR
jgi:hypothetical protein